MPFIVKTIISALIISLSTGLAKKNPTLGALILSLPVVSIIAFAIMGWEGSDPKIISSYAKSTLILVPISLVFFVPFCIPALTSWSFLAKFILGISSLTLINIILFSLRVSFL